MNRVRSLRVALGLSQRALADSVGTSQQQIQRIESGKIATKLDMASRICRALGKPLDFVFPGASTEFSKIHKNMESSGYLPEGDDLEPLRSIGLEIDPRNWIFRCLLQGHAATTAFRISPQERHRLLELVQRDEHSNDEVPFIVFDTSDKRIGLNRSELSYCHFLCDPEEDIPSETSSDSVLVTFCGRESSVEFKVESDCGYPDYEPFQIIFYSMECIVQPSDLFHFKSSDDEDVFLKASDIALIEVPLTWVNAAVHQDEEDED